MTPKGVVLAGKRAEMIFEYMPDDVGLLESFWRFSIVEHPDISVSFLLVGTVAEPEVYAFCFMLYTFFLCYIHFVL